MHKIMVIGAGKIGSLITGLLMESGAYEVCLVDRDLSGHDCARLDKFPQLKKQVIDVSDSAALASCMQANNVTAVISSLPYYCNITVAELAKQHQLHYFDLTEDTAVTKAIKEMAAGAKTAFVPQCGLAPGFISIAAHSLMQKFDEVDAVKMRVGALPINANNALQYSLTWSTEGLINEYGNLCHAIEQGQAIDTQPLEGLEAIQLDGLSYEAFNTSGGLGSLVELYAGKVNTMNYKTIRYPGHCEKMRLLMNDLQLNSDRDTLKNILERAIPKTYQDVVVIYVSVTGKQQGVYLEENYQKKVYPQIIAGHHWSAIQVTTAAGMCTVVDTVLADPKNYQGFVYQEKISLKQFLANPFGKYYEV